MRVNVYAEEMTGEVEIVTKVIDGREYVAVRFPLQLPASYVPADTVNHPHTPVFRPATVEDTEQATQFQAPFIHRPGDDDSSAVTFWGKRDLRRLLQLAIEKLDAHYTTKRKTEFASPVTDRLHQIASVDEESLTEDNQVAGESMRSLPSDAGLAITASERGAVMAEQTRLGKPPIVSVDENSPCGHPRSDPSSTYICRKCGIWIDTDLPVKTGE